MTIQRGRTLLAHAWASRGRATAEHPLPWLLAAVVFFVNALLTLGGGHWWLAILEFGTGLLAVLSAAAVSARSGGHDR